MIDRGENYLVTTDGWFYGPDGETYRAAWGVAQMFKTEDALGFTPSRPSTNWFLQIGNGDKSILIAGCQIHYFVKCKGKPPSKFLGKTYVDKDTGAEVSQDRIYYAQDEAPYVPS